MPDAYPALALSFLKIGIFGFGGGYAMLPLIGHEVVGVRGWATPAEFSDLVALSQITPGPIAVNAATYVGFTSTGVLGAALATLAVCAPPFALTIGVRRFFAAFGNNRRIAAVMAVLLRPAAAGLVMAAALTLLNRENFVDWRGIPIFLATLAMTARWKVSPIALVIAAGGAGWLLYGGGAGPPGRRPERGERAAEISAARPPALDYLPRRGTLDAFRKPKAGAVGTGGSMSRMYTGSGRMFQEVSALPMDEEGLQDIKRRVKLQPHFLGEPLVVVAEADDFPSVCVPGDESMVAVDALGRCAAITIAIGVADIDQQISTLQLAAHLAALTPEEIGRISRNFIDRSANEALRRLWEEMDVEMSEDSVEIASLLAAAFERDAEDFFSLINNAQRIIVAAEGFSSRLVGVIHWLNSCGVNAVGLRYRKFIVGGQDVFFAEQVVPMIDPAVDAPTARKTPATDAVEPWRVKGKAYHTERINPRLASLLDEILLMTKPNTFSLNWNNKYYFWIRGPRRNLRVRTYSRDRLEVGFYNAAPAAVAEFLAPYGLDGVEVVSIGGYSDSPFMALGPEARLDARWQAMLNDWLSGATPGKTRVAAKTPS